MSTEAGQSVQMYFSLPLTCYDGQLSVYTGIVFCASAVQELRRAVGLHHILSANVITCDQQISGQNRKTAKRNSVRYRKCRFSHSFYDHND